MMAIQGITSFSGGSFIGEVYPIIRSGFDIPRYILRRSHIPAELTRFGIANQQAIADLENLKVSYAQFSEDDFQDILDFQIKALSESRLIRMIKTRIRDAELNAEAAIEDSVAEVSRRYHGTSDRYMMDRAADIRALGNRLLTILQRGSERISETIPENAIIIAHEIGPAEMIRLIAKKTIAVIVAECGGFSHTAILARASATPLLKYAGDTLKTLKRGDVVGFDADRQELFIAPDKRQQKIIQDKIKQEQLKAHVAAENKPPYHTASGLNIKVRANIELPDEIEIAKENGAEGVGLLRTEFLFFQAIRSVPSEDQQYDILKNIALGLPDQVITIRTLDVGGDKVPPVLEPYFPKDAQSILGLRGINFCLEHREIFIPHIRAILRASQHGHFRILIPMITTIEDLQKSKALIASVRDDLMREKKLSDDFQLPDIGIMIEVPSAAICADIFAKECDFFAIGSNDLTQFTMIRDRSRQAGENYFRELDLAIIRLIDMSVKAATDAQIPVCLCGEAPHIDIIRPLLDVGVRDFSISPRNIPHFVSLLKDIE